MDKISPEMLAMARRIVADLTNIPGAIGLILAGDWDRTEAIQAALAAIKETTERAAEYVQGKPVWDMIKQNDADTSWHQSQIATALRNGDHLHAD